MSSEICKSPANPPQITENSKNIVVPKTARKCLQGKYDGRGKWKRIPGVNQKPGPKPSYVKALSRRKAVKVLEAFAIIAEAKDLYREAFERKQIALCWQMIQDVENRAFGKPFTAENPTIGAKAPAVHDQRLQVAINKFIVGNEAKVKRGKAAKIVQAKQLLEASVTTTPQPDQVAGE